MKKIISLIVSFVLVLVIIPFVDASATAELSSAEQTFINAVLNGESSLNLNGYKMTVSELNAAEIKLLYLHPEVWHYYTSCTYSYSGNYVTKISSFNYKSGYTKSKIKESLNTIEQLTDPILSGIRSNWSDVEKALYLYNYICVNYRYDTDIYAVRDNANFHIYELLTEGKGVCQSYAFLYKYLLDKIGIENYFVVSDIKDSDHAWNVIKINGKWHHVDVTYGDPCIALNSNVKIDFHGKVDQSYFLLSDSQINDGHHNNWYNPLGSKPVCVDYTGGELWKNADSAIVYENGYWYYLDYEVGGLVRTSDFVTNTHLATLEKKWYKGGNQNNWYNGYYSGIQVFNGHIIYSDSYRIYAYNIKNATVDYVAGLKSLENGSFFGFTMNDKTMDILVAKDIYSNYKTGEFIKEKYVICSDGHGTFADWRDFGSGRIYDCLLCGELLDYSYEIAGDADGNGVVDILDLATLKLALAGVYDCTVFSDIDKDGSIDVVDLATLKLKLIGVSV